jgi:hypothetical protein
MLPGKTGPIEHLTPETVIALVWDAGTVSGRDPRRGGRRSVIAKISILFLSSQKCPAGAFTGTTLRHAHYVKRHRGAHGGDP